MKAEENLFQQMDRLTTKLWECRFMYGESVKQFKKRLLIAALREHGGNVLETARALGIHGNTLSNQIAEMKIDLAAIRKPARGQGRQMSESEVVA